MKARVETGPIIYPSAVRSSYPTKTYGTALTAPQNVIERAILLSVCLSGDSWWR